METQFVLARLLSFMFLQLQQCIQDQWEQSTSRNHRKISFNMNLNAVPLLTTLPLAILTLETSDLQTSTQTFKFLLKPKKQLNEWEHLLHHLHLHLLLQTTHYLLECGIPPCDMVSGFIQLTAILMLALPCLMISLSNLRPMRRPWLHQRKNSK
jgi:hypothetical protein